MQKRFFFFLSLTLPDTSQSIVSSVAGMAIGGVGAITAVKNNGMNSVLRGYGRTATTLASSPLSRRESFILLDEPGQPVYSKNVKQVATAGISGAEQQ